jgi:hypothetical protein
MPYRVTPTADPPPYPRIPHLFPTDRASRDDLLVAARDRAAFLDEPVIVEEKLDGANVALWLGHHGRVEVATRGGSGAIDRAGQLGRLRAWAAERTHALGTLLDGGWVLYGEWLLLAHSVTYDHLPDLLIGLDLWSPEAGFAAIEDRDRRLADVGRTVAPRLLCGVLGSEEAVAGLMTRSRLGSEPAEGIVVRRDPTRTPAVAKVLSPAFVRADDSAWQGAKRPRNRVVSTPPKPRVER